MQNLYFLWSLERVAVLYNLPTIGDKDWYRWGAQVLVGNQGNKGNWTNGGYVGSTSIIDTCMALLFLKRANLVKDLTAKLPFTGAELNNDIMRILSPSAPQPTKPTAKTIPPIEPPKPVEPDSVVTQPPSPKPEATAEIERAPASTDGSKKKWIIISLILFVAFAGGSLVLLFAARRGEEKEAKPKDDKRKKLAHKRKIRSTAGQSEPEA